MPELPEVETVARELAALLPGKKVRSAKIIDHTRIALDRPGRLRGRIIGDVRRLGKWVIVTFEGKETATCAPLYLAVHLRMTGRLIVVDRTPTPSALKDKAHKHVRALFVLEKGALLFIDPRRFGVLELLESLAPLQPAGIDPTGDDFSAARLGALLQGSGQELKTWLMRQDRLVGLGNIYASEILYRARLAPSTLAGDLDAGEVGRLHRATCQILSQAIKHCGTTFSDFQGARGSIGSYQRYLAVYGREGQPCKKCSAPISRVVQQQRSTFFCARCQPSADEPQSHSP